MHCRFTMLKLLSIFIVVIFHPISIHPCQHFIAKMLGCIMYQTLLQWLTFGWNKSKSGCKTIVNLFLTAMRIVTAITWTYHLILNTIFGAIWTHIPSYWTHAYALMLHVISKLFAHHAVDGWLFQNFLSGVCVSINLPSPYVAILYTMIL